MRRIRRRIIQPLLRETELRKTDLVMPVFVDESISTPLPIPSMPGQFRHPVDGSPTIANVSGTPVSGR